jgi:enolase
MEWKIRTEGIHKGIANAVLIKLNQIGTASRFAGKRALKSA